jgi:hypothetical protein
MQAIEKERPGAGLVLPEPHESESGCVKAWRELVAVMIYLAERNFAEVLQLDQDHAGAANLLRQSAYLRNLAGLE